MSHRTIRATAVAELNRDTTCVMVLGNRKNRYIWIAEWLQHKSKFILFGFCHQTIMKSSSIKTQTQGGKER